jgi:hypothetical protein
MEDVGNKRVVRDKATSFQTLFDTLNELENTRVTRTRVDRLADKRHEKNQLSLMSSQFIPLSDNDVTFVGKSAPAFTKEERRIASVSDPTKSSTGGEYFYAALEVESQIFGNLFCKEIMASLYMDGMELDWVKNRPQNPTIRWRHMFVPLRPSAVISNRQCPRGGTQAWP